MLRIKGRPVLNIDHDGPIYDFTTAFYDWAREHTGQHLPYPVGWRFWEEWGWSEEEYVAVFRVGVERGAIWEEGYYVPGAAPYLWRLSDDGYHIRIVTSKLGLHGLNGEIIAGTIAWLDYYDVPYRSIAFLAHGEPKANYAAELLLDDNIGNCEDWASLRRPAILFDAHHNQGFENEENIVRARSWTEAYELIRGRVPL